MGDGILNDQSFCAIRVSQRHPKADRPAVVLHVKRVPGQANASVKWSITLAMLSKVYENIFGVGASLWPKPG